MYLLADVTNLIIEVKLQDPYASKGQETYQNSPARLRRGRQLWASAATHETPRPHEHIQFLVGYILRKSDPTQSLAQTTHSFTRIDESSALRPVSPSLALIEDAFVGPAVVPLQVRVCVAPVCTNIAREVRARAFSLRATVVALEEGKRLRDLGLDFLSAIKRHGDRFFPLPLSSTMGHLGEVAFHHLGVGLGIFKELLLKTSDTIGSDRDTCVLVLEKSSERWKA